jgi:ribosomal protein L30/L7E
MGRNPVVGRQGPAHHAAVIPSEQEAKRLRVKQIRSGIGHAETMRLTLKSIVEVDNTATMRGMLTKVRHLVDVWPAGGK